MGEDWSADVRKYDPDADEGVIAGIVRFCGIALHNRDSALVSFSDKAETDRVRESYLKKRLGLTQSDAHLDSAIAAVGERMRKDRTKNRVTVYYLLAQHFGKLALFGTPTATVPPGTPSRSYAARAVDDAGVAPPASGHWLIWLLLAALLLALLWYLFVYRPAHAPVPVATEVAAPVVAPVEPDATAVASIPSGAGVVSETRDGKPAVIVYFDAGKADVAPAFAPAAGALKAYLDANSGSGLSVSGYNDPTGDAAANALLSKNRAEAVKAALVAAAIPAAAIDLAKPANATDSSTTNAAARRVEIVVK